jgi:hypothetical protein
VEIQEPGSQEGERVAGLEHALGVHEDVYSLLHRHALHAQRTIVRAMDPVISRFAEAPAV